MQKPVNFETIGHTKYKILGLSWEIRVEGTANIGNGDFTRVWLIADDTNAAQIGRVFLLDMFFDKNKCEVFVPLLGDGDNGPHIKDYPIEPIFFKTPDVFKNWLSVVVTDLMNNFKLNDENDVYAGSTSLTFKVKSDRNDNEYNVEYVGKSWSCSCKGFVYSKAIPQTCKHILKQLS